MSQTEYIGGVVMSVQGTTPGPASGISYTVGINLASGVRIVDGVKPHGNRWPDALDIDGAAMVNQPIGGEVVGGRVLWKFFEPPVLRTCDGTVIEWRLPAPMQPVFPGGPLTVPPPNPSGPPTLTTVSPVNPGVPIGGGEA